jgi:hypothetical protein
VTGFQRTPVLRSAEGVKSAGEALRSNCTKVFSSLLRPVTM